MLTDLRALVDYRDQLVRTRTDEAVRVIDGVAAGTITEPELAAWIGKRLKERTGGP